MAYSIGFGGGGSPSSGRSVTGASSVYTYSMFSYPTGNLDINGNRPVANNGVSLSGSFGGGYTGGGADTSGNVYITSNGAATSMTGYIGNGYTMYSSNGFSWNGGFQGTFYWSTVPTAPQAISPVRTAGTTSVVVTISGSASDGGSGVTSYKVQYNSGGGWTAEQDISSGTYTYTGLTGGQSYQFRTYANNANGTSQALSSSSVAIPTVPGAPASIGVSTPSGRSVTVTAGNSSDGGAAISNYYVQASADNGSTWLTAQTMTAQSYTYTNLTGGATYKFRVYSTNEMGNSAFTTSASTFIPSGGKRYNGTTWVSTGTAMRYNGTTWVTIGTAKRFDGSTWVSLS